MQEIKLIVTDLDGTFLSHSETDGSLEENIKAMIKDQRDPTKLRFFIKI